MSDGIGIDFVPHTYTSNRTNIFFIILLSAFYAVKLSRIRNCGHSSVVERLVANEKVEGSSPFARSMICFQYSLIDKFSFGAGKGGRTLDLLVGNETLYH